ncbi:MAG: rRNA (uracil1498-N3)-methyltransferase [Tepidanaerobacteraceae bacterium]|nr:rRNA (uracil1498-N3)-methyltransferase [Tepidanaerobacteraceae bacterium]
MGCADIKAGPHRELMGVNFTPRFFVFKDFCVNDTVVISGDDARHIIKVLRYKPGDELKLSNGKDTEAVAVVEEIDAKQIIIKLKIIEKNKKPGIKPEITLFQSLLKGDKLDFILQKNTEIGVSKFRPIITERTIVELTQNKLLNRMQRWKKIAMEASKQCMRIDIPQILDVKGFDDSLKTVKDYDIAIIPWELENTCFIKDILVEAKNSNAESVAVFIGPEGGFSEEEISKAKKFGAVPVSLGPRILRAETAAIAVCTAIMYELGGMGGKDA